MGKCWEEFNISISELWGGVWRLEYFPSIRLFKHFFWKVAVGETSNPRRYLWCFFLDLLDPYPHSLT